ncbi:unnamed protein product [Alopecurus aequalis]
MDIGTGAMGSLLSKLVEVLKEEYKLQDGVKKDVEFLKSELTSIHAALSVVAEVPSDQLDRPIRVWADDVRELSYVMEDAVDSFLVRVEGTDTVAQPADKAKRFKKKISDMRTLLTKGKPRHEIGMKIKAIREQVNDVAERRNRYKIDSIVAKPTAASIDPRVRALYTQVKELVGINGERDQELIKLLAKDGDVSKDRLKVVSVVGFGGLGKTTFVQAVYKKIKSDFHCSAFVPVGRNADVKKVFRDLLLDLEKKKYEKMNLNIWDERRLIDEVRNILENKRYIIVIDDIWEEKMWEYIKCVFPDTNDIGSRLITTTRIVSVAKGCCSSRDDLIFHMKPLNDDDSKRLFHRRVFPSGSECPPEFEKLSEDILKKCGGVPLAIVTIASLLASDGQGKIKSVHAWVELLRSMGRGLTKGFRVEEMHMILSFSYYDLPSHLKTCLLYLSKFPEDHRIEREDLIWMWIAEGFICEEKETSLFELGETYFNDLIDRSLVQPVFDESSGNVEACRVHDIVLDLITSLSRKENFVTIWDGIQDSKSSQRISRRLSLQSDRKEDHHIAPCMGLSQVRSITVFPSAACLMPHISSFDVLRVLDLGGCNLAKSVHLSLKDVGNLLQLRYLGLRVTGICDLPVEIEKLQFLQVLDIRGNDDVEELPSVVCKLRRLVCLKVSVLQIPDGFGGLTSIEVLKSIFVSDESIKALFSLTGLRNLRIVGTVDALELQEAFMEYLSNLKNIQTVSFGGMGFMEHWEPPRHLRVFDGESYSRVPAWIRKSPTLYCDLSELYLGVKELQQEDMQMIGRLPGLCSFGIDVRGKAPDITVDGFPVVMYFRLDCSVAVQIMFKQGALPRVERVKFASAMPMEEDSDFGLRYLVTLREVKVKLLCPIKVGKAGMDKAEAALKQVLRAHPNHPSFSTSTEAFVWDEVVSDCRMS